MPIIRDYATTEVIADATSITVELPVHDTNDLLLIFVAKDAQVGGAFSTPGSWTKGDEQTVGNPARGAWYYLVASSSSETNPTISSTDSDAWHAVAISVKNVNTSNPINANAVTATISTMPFTSNTVTTTSNNCLVFHGLFSDQGIAPAAYPAGGVMNLSNQDAGSVSVGVAWEFKLTAGTTTARDWYGRTNETVRIFTVAVADDGNNTEVPAYLDPGTSSCTLIHGFQGTTDSPTGNTYPASLSLSTIGSLSTGYDAAAAQADTGVNPYQTSTRITPSSTTQTNGIQVNLASAQALTSGYLLGTYLMAVPRELIDLAIYTRGGLLFTVADAANDYKAWMIAAKDSPTTAPDARVNYAIQIDQATNTTFASSGTLNNIDKLLVTARASTGTLNLYFNMLVLVTKVVMVGGTAAFPIDFDDMFIIANTNLVPMMQRQGSSASLIWAPIQIGGGDPVHIVVNLQSFQFPEAYSASEKRLDWHVDSNQVGIDFYGQSGDTIKFTNCVFTSETSYYWTINALASSGASWDFTGTTVVNATVTLRNVMTFDSMTFVNCSSIDISGCTINNSNVSGAPAAGSGITVDSSSSVTNCEINTTSVSAGNSFVSTSTPDDISGTVFTGSASTGHAIRITATGTFDFSGNTFTSYGPTKRAFNTNTDVNSSTDVVTTDENHGYTTGAAVYYLKQGGTAAVGLTDGNLYYVRSIASNQLAFYTSAANAIADTSRVNLTASGTSENHEINSTSAAIYNNSGGLVTLNISDDGGVPSYRNSPGSSTIINSGVNLEVNGVVQNTQCYIVPSAGGSALMNEAATTLVSGNEYKATESINFTTNIPVTIRAREKGYLPFEANGTITASGLTVTAVWQVDPNWKFVVSGVSISFTNPSTITRASGDFSADGWVSVMSEVTVSGSTANDGTYTILSVGTNTLTITGATFTNEGPSSGVTLTLTRIPLS